MSAELVDLAERRFCDPRGRTLVALDAEHRVAELNFRLGVIDAKAMQGVNDRLFQAAAVIAVELVEWRETRRAA
jgi:hypothetical protein